jgi:glycosyltransferase involved in cell wall biosynthesis
MPSTSITAIVPAYNEEQNIALTIREIGPFLESEFNGNYEILLFDDCSTDRTGPIADELARENPKVRVIHNETNRNLGYNYKKGIELATKDYIIMIPGDNEITLDSFRGMFKLLGTADIIIPHTMNSEIRPLGRRILSKTYTLLMNTLFGLKIKYFNGTVIHKRSVLQSIRIETDSFAYQAEILIKLIKKGHTYAETGMWLKPRVGDSKALRLKNITRVLKAIWQLFTQIHFKNS